MATDSLEQRISQKYKKPWKKIALSKDIFSELRLAVRSPKAQALGLLRKKWVRLNLEKMQISKAIDITTFLRAFFCFWLAFTQQKLLSNIIRIFFLVDRGRLRGQQRLSALNSKRDYCRAVRSNELKYTLILIPLWPYQQMLQQNRPRVVQVAVKTILPLRGWRTNIALVYL